jgi:hypothetical protein
MITESDRLAHALESAAELWPDAKDDKGALVRRIVESGIEAVELQVAKRLSDRRVAIARSAGAMTSVWPANWRQELRDEWPA